jgi:hypothetical protein
MDPQGEPISICPAVMMVKISAGSTVFQGRFQGANPMSGFTVGGDTDWEIS